MGIKQPSNGVWKETEFATIWLFETFDTETCMGGIKQQGMKWKEPLFLIGIERGIKQKCWPRLTPLVFKSAP